MSMKEAFIKKIETQMVKWQKEIEEIEAKAQAEEAKAEAQKADAEIQKEYYQRLENLKTAYDNAANKLEELRQAGDDAWLGLKARIETAWRDIDDTIRHLLQS